MLVNQDSVISATPTKNFLFRHTLPSPSLVVCVIVPVRNEAACLVKTLNALRNQQDLHGALFSRDKYEILLLTNNCNDLSCKIAEDYQQAYPDFALRIADIQLPAEKAHIGTARRLLMDEAYHRFISLGKNRGIIASTDGDTEVDPKWVYYIIEEIQKGADAVGGRILVNSHDNQPGIYQTQDEIYRTLIARTESILDPLAHDPWPRHFQYFGASLAVTCEMYHRVGGLPQLPCLEDEALHKALFCRDAKIRKSPAVKVMTSSRHEGRVTEGLSEQLKKWAQMETTLEPQMVASAREIISKYTHRHIVRTCWNEAEMSGTYNAMALASVAREFLISPLWLREEMEKNRYFGQLWENIEKKMHTGAWYGKWKPVMITKAIQHLSEFTSRYN